MKTLMIYPEFPDTFWSFKHALRFVRKKATFPPLGLLTVAGMLPKHWEKRLVDLNTQRLTEKDLAWADCAFVSAMGIQRDSAKNVIRRCKDAGLKVVAGGPLFAPEHEDFEDVDHFVLNEAELTLPAFVEDFSNGNARRMYQSDEFADITASPVPEWHLASMDSYVSMAIQYSRGCPFACDFCNITSLLGHKVRTKSSEQVIAELDGLYAAGWRDRVFFVDDNFIGNKRRLKTDLLPKLIEWQRKNPGITFQTEASIDLADDAELMDLMFQAGFHAVFIGIETPEEESLAECSKRQNEGRDLVEDVKRIQRAGMQVQGGFIVGFDHDKPSIFRSQIDFIQRSGIVTAMVGILQAPPGTKLYDRMTKEGRIVGLSTGDNVDGTTNIIPTMDIDVLRRGYREILNHIYSPRNYYARLKTFLREYKVPQISSAVTRNDRMALLRSVGRLGIMGKERLEYWKLLGWTFLKKPRLVPLAITLAISGFHFRKVVELHVR